MFKLYRNIKPRNRLLILGALLLLGLAVAFQYKYSIPLVGGGILGLGLILHVVATRTRILLATLIILGQIAIMGYSGIIVANVVQTVGLDGTLAGLTFQYLSLLSTILLSIAAYYLVSGRFWVNLFLGFLIHNIVFVVLVSTVTYGVDLGISFGTTLIFFALRTLIRKKKKPFILGTRSTKEISKTETLLVDTMESTVKPEGESYIDFISYPAEENKVYAIFTLDVKKSVNVYQNTLLMDGKDITPLLELVIRNARKFGHDHKISKADIIPVILTHKDAMPKIRLVINVRARRKPDISIGSVVVSTPAGLKKTLETYSKAPALKPKQLKRVKAL